MTKSEFFAFFKSLQTITKMNVSDKEKIEALTDIIDSVVKETSNEKGEK